jgi:hypothetical protein
MAVNPFGELAMSNAAVSTGHTRSGRVHPGATRTAGQQSPGHLSCRTSSIPPLASRRRATGRPKRTRTAAYSHSPVTRRSIVTWRLSVRNPSRMNIIRGDVSLPRPPFPPDRHNAFIDMALRRSFSADVEQLAAGSSRPSILAASIHASFRRASAAVGCVVFGTSGADSRIDRLRWPRRARPRGSTTKLDGTPVTRPAAPVRRAATLCAIVASTVVGCMPKQTDSAGRIVRGGYLANGIARCFWCHSPLDSSYPAVPIPATLGSGNVLFNAPNITPDPETGLGRWTDWEIVRAIREGIGREGRELQAHPSNLTA